jgi:hypothetical protein
MKRFIVFLLISLPFFSFTDSRSYVYVNPHVVDNLDAYTTAIGNADFDKYRYFDKRNTLHFDSGLDVELLSANELKEAGIPYKADRIRTEDPAFDTKAVFKLTTDGKILEVQTRVKIK